ncbi:transcription factor HHO5-like [Vitis riparia]|uniref:transcription factor HHO5-like n=1 Tax=Vitis riparia TaxID=96939 RepID=UPI00155A992F|nr:transcription factor HHO5-like [Vitis riparia]
MDSDSLELSLGTEKQCYIPPSITHFLNHLSRIRDVSKRLAELNDYVSKLEQEMRKLDALKRNPQRCMLLLKDAVEFLKKEGEKMKRDIEFKEPKWPVLKEFLPLKRSFNEEEHRAVPMEKEYGREEENLTMNCHYEKRHKSTLAIPKPCKLSIGGGGAFTPFKATMAKTEVAKEVAEEPVLSLLLPGTQNSRPQLGNNHLLPEPYNNAADGTQTERLELGYNYPVPKNNDIGKGVAHHQPFNPQAVQQHQAIWKNNRRCWSPELHARFMAAMDFLGGPEGYIS